TRSSRRRSLRLPRTGTLIFICATASAGVRRVSRSASSEAGCSIRSSVSLSSATGPSLRLGGVLLVPDGVPSLLRLVGKDRVVRVRQAVVDDVERMGGIG